MIQNRRKISNVVVKKNQNSENIYQQSCKKEDLNERDEFTTHLKVRWLAVVNGSIGLRIKI